MRKKQFLQFRRAMATLLAVAMIGQNTVMTTAENYVADNTAVVAEEQAQEPEVQVEESASPAVQESAPAAETPAEPAAQAVAETLLFLCIKKNIHDSGLKCKEKAFELLLFLVTFREVFFVNKVHRKPEN